MLCIYTAEQQGPDSLCSANDENKSISVWELLKNTGLCHTMWGVTQAQAGLLALTVLKRMPLTTPFQPGSAPILQALLLPAQAQPSATSCTLCPCDVCLQAILCFEQGSSHRVALPVEAGSGCGWGPGCRSSIGAGCAGAARSGTGQLFVRPVAGHASCKPHR